jgi:hypothetical protein
MPDPPMAEFLRRPFGVKIYDNTSYYEFPVSCMAVKAPW